MARIRTIKPEFPQSESMGRICRDARLCFIQLWTIADDSGRLRGSSRMLASILFPYDDDAPDLMDGWLAELEREGCIERYQADGATYIQINGWHEHQKIDKPSLSKIPPPTGVKVGNSRILANPRESSSEEGTKEGTKERDQGEDHPRAARKSTPATDDLFPAFWARYPRKVGRPVAEKAFAKHKPDQNLLDLMLSAIDVQSQSRDWLKDGGQYIPHPSTWLNQERWKDVAVDIKAPRPTYAAVDPSQETPEQRAARKAEARRLAFGEPNKRSEVIDA